MNLTVFHRTNVAACSWMKHTRRGRHSGCWHHQCSIFRLLFFVKHFAVLCQAFCIQLHFTLFNRDHFRTLIRTSMIFSENSAHIFLFFKLFISFSKQSLSIFWRNTPEEGAILVATMLSFQFSEQVSAWKLSLMFGQQEAV